MQNQSKLWNLYAFLKILHFTTFFTFILCHIVVLMQKEAIKTQKTSFGFLNKGIINFKVKHPFHISV